VRGFFIMAARVKAARDFKFQINLSERWTNFGADEDRALKRAYLIGHESARCCIRGQCYVYNFREMTQMNLESGKTRQMRQPYGWRRPGRPLLPIGNAIVVTVRPGQPGTVIEIANPSKQGEVMKVSVPARAKVGSKLAVPVPSPGESVEDVVKKQEEQQRKEGWSAGGKVAAGLGGVALAGGLVVGGALLGDHLAGGTVAVDAAGSVADALTDAGDWIADAATDVGDALGDFAEDAGDWLGDAGEDAGDWIVSLF
jgi:hypothetical protein